jgi:hypothetical protein
MYYASKYLVLFSHVKASRLHHPHSNLGIMLALNDHLALAVILGRRVILLIQVFDRIGEYGGYVAQSFEPFSTFMQRAEHSHFAALDLPHAVYECNPPPSFCDVLCPEQRVIDHQHAAATSHAAFVDCALHFPRAIPRSAIVVSHQCEELVHKRRLACVFGVR